MKIASLFLFLLLIACHQEAGKATPEAHVNAQDSLYRQPPVIVGAERMGLYLPVLKDKKVGLVVNHTSLVGSTHLVDTLVALGVNVKRIFAPEHGFRGTADAGQHINGGMDAATGVEIISLYGNDRKPAPEVIKDLDMVVFDIQDVGVRFYTYISTMSYVMEVCADEGVRFMVLDRPNPNGHYIDGPIMQSCCTSFIGLHSVPVVHGMTVGEYAQMVNGEGWLGAGKHLKLEVIPCKNYDHNTFYDLPVKPSPNLPNMASVYLYPSLCFFEATPFSVGRGTTRQFQIIGHPDLKEGDIVFTPQSMPGATHPKWEGQPCVGYDFSGFTLDSLQRLHLNVGWLIEMYRYFGSTLFESHFYKLAGSKELQNQIEDGWSREEIENSWQPGLKAFSAIRSKYLLYTDYQ